MLNGIFLGLMTSVSVIMTFVKLPGRVKHWLATHELVTDFLGGLLVWGVLGLVSKTLTAVIGAVIAEISLATALYLYIRKENNGD